MKYLGPWLLSDYRYTRCDLSEMNHFHIIRYDNEWRCIGAYAVYNYKKSIVFQTKEDAIQAYDKLLIELGYVFLTEDQFEKLKSLI